MHKSQIYEGESYLSIHGVPYRVVKRDEQMVSARCETGRHPKHFEMEAGRFAEAMSKPAHH